MNFTTAMDHVMSMMITVMMSIVMATAMMMMMTTMMITMGCQGITGEAMALVSIVVSMY